VLHLPATIHAEIVGHCLRGLPDEACGLLGGDPASGAVQRCYRVPNAAASAKLYTIDPREFMHADRDAEERAMQIIGVFHSHTHTDAYPSPTDVERAADPMSDPAWHYVIVSLRDTHPVLRSFRVRDGRVDEEPVVLEPAGAPG
jgi:[CysO sulfur-carrier protein]-S-L-cysteine hydrolase